MDFNVRSLDDAGESITVHCLLRDGSLNILIATYADAV
jgi:hypothetical protein